MCGQATSCAIARVSLLTKIKKKPAEKEIANQNRISGKTAVPRKKKGEKPALKNSSSKKMSTRALQPKRWQETTIGTLVKQSAKGFACEGKKVRDVRGGHH